MTRKQKTSIELGGNLPVPEGDATHKKVLDAGLNLFTEFGMRRTTMEDVAGRAGIGRATLYRRFREKDQLVQAVILRECQRNLLAIEESIREIASPLDALLEAFVLAVTRAHAHPLLVRLLSSEPETILPFLTNEVPSVLVSMTHAYLAQQIAVAQKSGAVHARSADHTAEMMLRLVQSFVLSPRGGMVDPGDEKALRAFVDSHLRPLLTP